MLSFEIMGAGGFNAWTIVSQSWAIIAAAFIVIVPLVQEVIFTFLAASAVAPPVVPLLVYLLHLLLPLLLLILLMFLLILIFSWMPQLLLEEQLLVNYCTFGSFCSRTVLLEPNSKTLFLLFSGLGNMEAEQGELSWPLSLQTRVREWDHEDGQWYD